MKIIRNGQEIELTREEVYDAYCEKQREYDMEDLEHVCEVNEYDLTENEKKKVVELYRRKYESEDWFYQLAYCCEEVIEERKV